MMIKFCWNPLNCHLNFKGIAQRKNYSIVPSKYEFLLFLFCKQFLFSCINDSISINSLTSNSAHEHNASCSCTAFYFPRSPVG